MPVSKVSLGKFYVAIGSARRIRIALTHALWNISFKKIKTKNRSSFRTFMNMQSWSTLHGLPDSQAQEESTCVYIGIPGGNVLGNMYARTRPPRSACEMRRLDKKCIFGSPGGSRRRRLCISRLFSALFSLLVVKSRGGWRCINISYSKYSP